MEGIRHRTLEVNGISMHVAEAGDEDAPAILFVHGFPELWYTWRHQMVYLAEKGYRCIAPDLRGYGETTGPESPTSYTAFHIVGDLVALLDALEIPQVFLVGHDFGAFMSWYFCMFRPDRVKALVNTSIAFMRHVMIRGVSTVKPVEFFKKAYGPDYYICEMQEPGVEARKFSPAAAKFLFRILLGGHPLPSKSSSTPMPTDPKQIPLPSWLSEEEVEYYVTTFEKTGFTGAINYFRCFDLNWELSAPWEGVKVNVPTKFIAGDKDMTYKDPRIQEYIHKGGFHHDVPSLEEVTVLEGAGHFLQLERADEVSEHIYDYIKKF